MTPGEDDWEAPPAKDLSPEPDFRPIPKPKPKTRRGLWIFAGVLVVAGAAGAGGWYFLNDWLGAEPGGEVPLIRADSNPVKVRPEEPGGMDVPDRDKLVYDRIDGGEDRSSVERLLPPPENPLPKPEPPASAEAGSTTPSAPAESVDTVQTAQTSPSAAKTETPPPAAPEKVVPSVEDVLKAMQPPPPVETKKAAEATKPAEASKEQVASAPAPAPAPVPAPPSASKPAPAKAPVATKTGAYRIQLAALRSRDGVESEWKRLRSRNKDLLGELELSVMRADLGPGKGVFFRLRAGPLADEQAAKALCQKLSERKVGCLVVRPEG